MVYFKEDFLHEALPHNTNPSAKRAAIELETRANTSEGNLEMKATKFRLEIVHGWFIIPGPGI